MKNQIIFISMFCIMMGSLAAVPSVNAVSFLGIDFGEVWDTITFWNNDDEPKEEVNKNENSNSSSNSKRSTSNTSQTTKPKAEVKIVVDGTEYSSTAIKAGVNGNEQLTGYIKAFGYECMYVNTDKNASFTLKFNLETGKITDIKNGNSCADKEIFLEESLISDIKTNGFQAGNAKDYLKKVDLPTSMYFKVIKVFTVG